MALSNAAIHGDPLILRSVGGPAGLQERIDNYTRPTIDRALVHESLAALCSLEIVAGVIFRGSEWLSGDRLDLALSIGALSSLSLINNGYSKRIRQ